VKDIISIEGDPSKKKVLRWRYFPPAYVH